MSPAKEERLQKFLARAGVASRRKSEELITAGRVTINGQVAGLGDKVDPERDAVKLDGKRIQPQTSFHYLLLYKPRAVMSTVADPEGRPTVLDLVPPALRKALVPVGRLDFLSEGLLLLTDDGDLAQKVAHPRYGCSKTYEVKVRGAPTERDLDRLRAGILLDGRRTSPAEIRRHRPPRGGRRADPEAGNTWWQVTLGEGRHRQIRDMFQRIGHPVGKLRRVAIGPVTDRHLKPGGLRELREEEVEALRSAGPGPARRPRRRAGAAGAGKARSPASGGGRASGGPPARGGSSRRGSSAPSGRSPTRGGERGDPARSGKTGGGETGGVKAGGGPPRGGKTHDGRPRGGKPGGATPRSGKPAGGRPGGAKPKGGKPRGGKPKGGKPSGGKRSGGGAAGRGSRSGPRGRR